MWQQDQYGLIQVVMLRQVDTVGLLTDVTDPVFIEDNSSVTRS